ncbi:unnamed protein product [Urochloa humidicola]
MLPLTGKVAVIAGAANAIGKAIATKFATNGAKVMVADQDAFYCYEIAAGLHNPTAVPGITHAMAGSCDVTKPSKIREAFEKAKELYQQDVDIFYNNSNAAAYSVDSIGIDNLRSALETNVESVLESIEYAGDVMRKSKNGNGGCILCTGSTLGLLGDMVWPYSAYSISKTAILSAIRAKGAELVTDGVRVHAISPHLVAPTLNPAALKKIYPGIKFGGQLVDDIINNFYLKNQVTEEDVASAALYLASGDRMNLVGYNMELKEKFVAPP